MLVDIKQHAPDIAIGMVLSMISDGALGLERIGKGMYLCGHWSVQHIVPVKCSWRDDSGYVSLGEIPEYGVCDTPDQAIEKLRLEDIEVPVFVTFVRIRRDEQPPSGGWRWHKWGEYIGNKEPLCEYIHDEPEIDEVYTFHIYQPK